jgi:hypothetical protein
MPPLFGKLRRLWGGRGWVELKAAQPMSTTIGQIEFELEKAWGYPMTPSASAVAQHSARGAEEETFRWTGREAERRDRRDVTL